MILKLFFLFPLLVLCLAAAPSVRQGKESLGIRSETLDRDGKYIVSWEAFTDTQTIYFNVTVETLGYIGFGISPVGGMAASDIFMGGVYPNGTAYFTDYHGTGNRAPVIDDHQDWELLTFSQSDTHTTLGFARLLNTCDDQDVSIGNDTTNFIWAFGDSDDIQYHSVHRGTVAMNVLDPPIPPFDNSEFLRWKMSYEMVMPTQRTTYWCTVQKSPPLATKHHIVGFRPLLDSEAALKYTHHFIVHKCTPPAGSSAEETFEHLLPSAGGLGGECYRPSAAVPLAYCKHYLFVWGAGGKQVIYPDHVGYPVGANGEPTYYLLEIHYDNPNGDANIRYEAGLELFYTPRIRQYDAGTITTGHETEWTITIPPKSENYTIVGHCAPECSNNIPPSGVKVFNVLLHSHLAGRKMKLRHFRGNQELPWMSVDNNYNFDYQQNRPLIEERVILPGDHLTYECVYDATLANGTILGGLSTAEEMCNAFLWYYPDIGLEVCSSAAPRDTLMALFGIESWQGGAVADPLITAPANYAGKRYTEVLDTMIDWTAEKRNEIQQLLRYGNHLNVCTMGNVSITSVGKQQDSASVTYPDIEAPYEPVNECPIPNEPTTTPSNANAIHFISKVMFCVLYFPILFYRQSV